MQILIWLLTDDDPEVKKTSISHGINASRANDDLIFRICSYLSDWYRLHDLFLPFRLVPVAKGCGLAVQICNPREQAALWCRRFETPWNRACPQYHDQTSTATRIYSNEIDHLRVNKMFWNRVYYDKAKPVHWWERYHAGRGRTGEHPCIIPHEHPIARATVYLMKFYKLCFVKWKAS